MKLRLLLGVLLFVTVVIECKAKVFNDVAGGSEESGPFSELEDSDVEGKAATNWYFKSANISGGQAIKDAKVSSDEKTSYTSTQAGKTFNFVTFTIVLSGDITKIGPGGGGTMPTYSLTARRDGELFLETSVGSESGSGFEVTIFDGESITFYGKEKFNNVTEPIGDKKCDWALLPATYKVNGTDYTPSPLFLLESTSLEISPSSTYKTPDPGLYTIKAKASPSAETSDNWVTATLKVRGISEIQAQVGSGSYSSVSEDLYVAVGETLNVKAIIKPDGETFPSGTPEWSISGDGWFSSRVTGTGETKLVDTSEISDADGFTISMRGSFAN